MHVLNLIWFGYIARLSKWGRGGGNFLDQMISICLPSRRERGVWVGTLWGDIHDSYQCCGSGSGIRDEQPGSYFPELRNHFFGFFGVKILKFFDADPGSGIRDGDSSDPGSGMEKSARFSL
jgi:hypothetical protein